MDTKTKSQRTGRTVNEESTHLTLDKIIHLVEKMAEVTFIHKPASLNSENSVIAYLEHENKMLQSKSIMLEEFAQATEQDNIKLITQLKNKIRVCELLQSTLITELRLFRRLLQENINLSLENKQLKSIKAAELTQIESENEKLVEELKYLQFVQDENEKKTEIKYKMEIHQMKLDYEECNEIRKSQLETIRELKNQIETLEEDRILNDGISLQEELEVADQNLQPTALSEDSSQPASTSGETSLFFKAMFGFGAIVAVGSILYAMFN